ncbi:MAG: ROK family protein [Planctomycetota bacterium]
MERLVTENELQGRKINGIGIGCPGPIDLHRGRILMTPNLGWDDVAVGDFLTERFRCTTIVMNDVDAGLYGEYQFGAARKARCAVGVFPGTGIGGACVYEGRILQGNGVSCMEIGHTRISSGSRSSGGLPGTLEAEASRLSIAAEAAKAAFRGDAPVLAESTGTDLSDIRSGALAESVEGGDAAVRRLIEAAAESVGVGVANLIHILCPDIVVLGGGLVEAMEELIVGTVEKTARASVMEAYRERFKVVAAELGDDAGVKGAAAWARRAIEQAAETSVSD